MIDVEEVLAHQIEGNMRNQLSSEYQEKLQTLTKKEKQLQESEKKQQQIIDQKVQKLEQSLRQELDKEYKNNYEKQISSLSDDIDKREKELSELKDKEIELEKMKRVLQKKDKDFELRLEKALTESQQKVEEEVAKRETQRYELKLHEKDKKLTDLEKQIAGWKRKAEQGSTQLQGEVQELAIENILIKLFPDDEIMPIPKGKTGADTMLIVHSKAGQVAGKILFESKRTKSFQKSWIEKLKDDQRKDQADVAVLVTETMPDDLENIGIIDGIWVSSFQFLKPLSMLLHDGILRVHAVRVVQKNSGDKMQMLYDYLTSNEFKMQLEAILEGFFSIKQSLDKERLVMEKIWKEREKQLSKVLTNTTQFYASVKGIAGSGVPEISLLEFNEQ